MPRSDRYDIHKIRKQVRSKVEKGKDPTEFRPPKAEDGKTYKFRFYILPPFKEGDKIATGEVADGMEEFFLRNGSHYLERKQIGCPRVLADLECGICQHGFDLMSETEEREERAAIARRLLPGTYMMVNIFFPKCKENPEELWGKIKWYNCPKTVFDEWEACLYRDDDGGSPHEPLAWGVFYDEYDAYLFQLEVYKFGRGNNYGKSKFIVTETFRSRPVGVTEKEADDKKITAILGQRHNLFDKLPDLNTAHVEKLARNLRADGDGDESGGFDADETASQSKKSGGIKPNIAESSKSTGVKPDDDAVEIDDDVDIDSTPDAGDEVSDELPADEESSKEPEKTPEKKKTKAKDKPKDKPKDEPVPEADGDAVDDDDVEALLSQLNDDD